MEIAMFVFLIILLFLSLSFLGFKEHLWVKERRELTKMFEEEKRSIAKSMESKELAMQEKQNKLVETFMTEMKTLQGKYAEGMAQFNTKTAKAPFESETLNDFSAFMAENAAVNEILEKHPEVGRSMRIGHE